MIKMSDVKVGDVAWILRRRSDEWPNLWSLCALVVIGIDRHRTVTLEVMDDWSLSPAARTRICLDTHSALFESRAEAVQHYKTEALYRRRDEVRWAEERLSEARKALEDFEALIESSACSEMPGGAT